MTGVTRIGDFSEIPGIPRISKVSVYGGLAYTSGVVGEPGFDVREQTTQVLARIDELLELANSDRSRIISAQVWLADMADFAAHNDAWDEWVDPDNLPARACVQSALLDPRLLVEIRVIAAVADDDRSRAVQQ
jgi:enamine deaminase RidA (YjgF/YER057c/UK114 family)